MIEKKKTVALTVRIDPRLHEDISRALVGTGLSFHSLAVEAFEAFLKQYQSGGKVETKPPPATPSPTEQDLMERLYRWTQPPYEDGHHKIMAEMVLKMVGKTR